MPKALSTPFPKRDSYRNVITQPALLFDLDGTLVDSVYQHVAAWREALDTKGIRVPTVRIHRSVGMSGRLMLQSIFAEISVKPTPQKLDALEKLHKNNFEKRISSIQPLRGAPDLLRYLSRNRIPWAIATSGDRRAVHRIMRPLHIPASIPVITGDDVENAKPHPDLFLAAANRLGIPLASCTVIGDSVWDLLAAQRAKSLGVGLLTGGYSATELAEAGAFRIYDDPAHLLEHIAELGVISEQ
jgi:HAD superfamily hydrolase (TIGR01509 family)